MKMKNYIIIVNVSRQRKHGKSTTITNLKEMDVVLSVKPQKEITVGTVSWKN
jgi:hypothetical protein